MYVISLVRPFNDSGAAQGGSGATVPGPGRALTLESATPSAKFQRVLEVKRLESRLPGIAAMASGSQSLSGRYAN